ncbi:hypothetical protein DPMN_082603 [Dreissena polymorpha]|uniref:Uncharacterized protein n=1 Tax=Dreissena polymorpha TaxID=45954 RepID=A0A9D3YB21_DREPO|nr:hypothetical protein DPMN_082603 [Dreissena polymorpha]
MLYIWKAIQSYYALIPYPWTRRQYNVIFNIFQTETKDKIVYVVTSIKTNSTSRGNFRKHTWNGKSTSTGKSEAKLSTTVFYETAAQPLSASLKTAHRKRKVAVQKAKRKLVKSGVSEDLVKELTYMLPSVLHKLKELGLLGNFSNMMRLIDSEKLP